MNGEPQPPRPPLFRSEAVEHHARGRRGGRPVDTAHHRTARASVVLAAAIVAAIVAGCLVQAEETTEGPLQPGPSGAPVVALVPAAAVASGQLHRGLRAKVSAAHRTSGATVVDVGDPVVAGGGAAVVPVTLAIDAGPAPGTGSAPVAGRAVIRLRRRPVVTLLVPSLRSLVARG